MFTLVLNNGEEFKLTLWDGQSFELTTEGLVSRARLEPLPCTLVFSTGSATGYLYIYGESKETVLELCSHPLSGHMVKWGNGATVMELQTSVGALYGQLYGAGSGVMELAATLYGSGNAVTADQSRWQYIYEFDTSSPHILIDQRGSAHSELELETVTGALYGSLYGKGTEALELITPTDVTGSATVADQSQWNDACELLTVAAVSTAVVPAYVGVDIDKTVGALGDITMAEYCRREVTE